MTTQKEEANLRHSVFEPKCHTFCTERQKRPFAHIFPKLKINGLKRNRCGNDDKNAKIQASTNGQNCAGEKAGGDATQFDHTI